MSVDNELRGRLALITGASGGIGAGCARDLYRQGCHLALTYSKNKANVDSLVAELQASPSDQRISSHQVDMASTEDMERLFQEIGTEHSQGPDILIANAGYGKRIPQIQDISYEEWDYTIQINLRAPFVLAKLAVPHMAQQKWGRIIMMGSIAGYGGGINGCHYAASKAGLMGMVKNLALKLAKDGITVNDVAPAMIGETGMIPDAKFLVGTPGDVKNIPVGRLGTTQECANVVTMICKTGYLTGQSILLSGGLK
ncbi:3-oxoacyl-[acyl-carrier protein] reductase [Capronia coronata CBS 617.96]|uniref:3-oxoacyl-[acyl-carrier protein] reductase n=1 Tax=Capronia coronata CBS 617.96 TaxID=1182541 RepID=W9YPT2_9EURO|nr:3-oxoacyl-[acyl-carrier protein] reductase [Capronia coronata CBS 617.96]EXJ94912.1 3-oxoacyl-[acyl-carrier protein] reductase [Capronia coronata CBS 617.96]